LWDGCEAQAGEGVEVEPDWDEAAQLAPQFEVDQRINWWLVEASILTLCGIALRPAHAAHRKSLS